MSEQKFISAANLFGWGQSFNATGKFPLIAKRVWKTYADMLAFVSDTSDVCPAGVVLTVINDTDTKKNGAYFVASCPTLENPNLPVEVQKIGSGETLTAETYEAAVLLATDDNIGSIIYVKSDSDGGTKGPYVVAGAKVIQKLGTTTSTGDISGDVSNLKTDVALLKADENTEGSIAYALKPIKNKLDTVEENAQVNLLEKVFVDGQELTVTDKSVYIELPGIVDNLESTDSTKVLSAKQGKVLKEALTKVEEKLTSVYSIKGSKDNYSDLPTNAAVGDVYNVVNAVLPDMTIELADGSSAKLLKEKVSFEGVTYFMFTILSGPDYFLTSEAPETLTVGSKLTYADVYSEAGETVINWGYEQEIVSINNSGKPYPAGTNFVWNGTNWDALGGSVDFSGYYDKAEVEALIKVETDRAKEQELLIWEHADAGVQAAQSAIHLANGNKEAIDNLSVVVEDVYSDLYGKNDPYTGQQVGYIGRLEAIESVVGNDNAGLVAAVNTLTANVETEGSVDYKIGQAFKWNEVN